MRGNRTTSTTDTKDSTRHASTLKCDLCQNCNWSVVSAVWVQHHASALMWVSTQQTATQQTATQQMPHSRCQVHRYMLGATSYIRHHRRTLLPMQITFWISVTPTTQTCTPQHTNPSRPQQQHTNPSCSCVLTCVLDLRFVVPLLEFFT